MDLPSFENAKLIFADRIRDGGSMVLVLTVKGRRVRLRSMQSIAEQKTSDFRKIEITRDRLPTVIVDHVQQIGGLAELLACVKERVDSDIIAAFS